MKKNITVTKPFLPPVEEYKKLVDKIWENCWVTNNGPFNKKFKEKLKEYLGVSNICLTVNGHMALDIAIKGLGIKRRSNYYAVYFCFHYSCSCFKWIDNSCFFVISKKMI